MPMVGIVHLVYTMVFLIYFLIQNIFYPTHSFFRRTFKDLLFGAIKLETIFGTLSLTTYVFHWDYHIIIPIITILTGFINVPFSWLFRKMFPSYWYTYSAFVTIYKNLIETIYISNIIFAWPKRTLLRRVLSTSKCLSMIYPDGVVGLFSFGLEWKRFI